MNALDKILVVQTSFLGDAVLTTPLLAALRRLFPQAELSVLCTPQAKSIFVGNPNADAIITDDKRGEGRGLAGLWWLAKIFLRRRFKISSLPQHTLPSGCRMVFLPPPGGSGSNQP